MSGLVAWVLGVQFATYLADILFNVPTARGNSPEANALLGEFILVPVYNFAPKPAGRARKCKAL